jgi:hypothetical protein
MTEAVPGQVGRSRGYSMKRIGRRVTGSLTVPVTFSTLRVEAFPLPFFLLP